MKERPNWTEYIQPGLMAMASMGSVIASTVAIMVGADRTADGRLNPFFYMAAVNSVLYSGANAYKMYQIYRERNPVSFVNKEEKKRLEGELTELIVR